MLPEENNEPKNEYEQLRSQSRKMKRRLILILTCVVGCLILISVLIKILDTVIGKDEIGVPDGTYEFYPTYEGNILENPDYLELNRQVSYCNDPSGYGLTQSITDENRADFDANTLFLYDFLQTIIAGDASAYNACFHETYYKDNERKTSFSPQMLYNMEITYQSSESGESGDKLVTYLLEYMIYRNDGTFRRDIDSGASRPQYITLRVSADGSILIEKSITVYTK